MTASAATPRLDYARAGASAAGHLTLALLAVASLIYASGSFLTNVWLMTFHAYIACIEPVRRRRRRSRQ